MTTLERRLGVLAGVVSAGAGLAASELTSGLLHQRVSPVVAVAESIIRLTPGAVVEQTISLVGHYDKPLVIAGTLVGLCVLSGLAGMLALRSLAAGEAMFAVMGVVLVLAVRARLTSSEATYIPAVVGVLIAMLALAALAPRAGAASSPRTGRSVESPLGKAPTATPTGGSPTPNLGPGSSVAGSRTGTTESRRDFLRLAGVVGVGSVVLGLSGRVLAQGRAALDSARERLKLPVSRPVQPAGVSAGVPGVVPWNTSQADFYRIDTALSIPQILPDDWSLRIHGMVDQELDLSYQDLLDRGLTEAWLTLCCVSNEVGGDLISNAWWSGVRIADVLAEAGVQSDADAVMSRSSDDWTCGTPLAALTDDRNALFAVAMNGEPLTPEHGFPVRMVVPGLYGYVSATKWVVDLEVTRFSDFSAFWTERGWAPQGPVKTQSRIDVPRGGERVKAGKVAIGGIAWAQHTGIAEVEVRVDDGDWQPAKLAKDATIDSWRQWSYVWAAEPGEHRIQVRATDRSGQTQTEALADVLPDGATGWHTIEVDVA
ncbi:MAG TPA: molybdopterin-dependent oxidoreductase [Nocardioidaceae bacterium]|nr:molybdopterin-dependent oxidoreductase [Nocardioidaceae bacterium]